MITLNLDYKPPVEDVVHLHELLQSEYVGMYGEPDPDPTATLETLLKRDGAHVVGYLSDGMAVGLAMATYYDEVARLHRVYTHFLHRGHGFGRQLTEAMENIARADGRPRLELETGVTQTRAISMYKSMGYTPTAPFGYYKDEATSVFLGKDL